LKLIPHLSFNGDCEEALHFYEKTLGGKIEFMAKYEGTPAETQVPGDWRKKIMHATFSVSGQTVMAVDAPTGHYKKPQGFAVSINVDDQEEAQRIFKALSESGVVQMPMQKTFWSPAFGMVTDRFGTPWMVNCENPK